MCCPNLRVTATGPAKTVQSSRFGTYEYYKLGVDGKETFKQIGSQQYLYFEPTYEDWMVSHTFWRLSIEGRNYINL